MSNLKSAALYFIDDHRHHQDSIDCLQRALYFHPKEKAFISEWANETLCKGLNDEIKLNLQNMLDPQFKEQDITTERIEQEGNYRTCCIIL